MSVKVKEENQVAESFPFEFEKTVNGDKITYKCKNTYKEYFKDTLEDRKKYQSEDRVFNEHSVNAVQKLMSEDINNNPKAVITARINNGPSSFDNIKIVSSLDKDVKRDLYYEITSGVNPTKNFMASERKKLLAEIAKGK